jgi:hypothetical protein
MADVSHVGGLTFGACATLRYGFDVVTTTTHKIRTAPAWSLPRHAAAIDKSVFPGLQGGPHMNTIAAVAVTLKKAQEPAFRAYAAQVLRNARVLADTLLARGCALVTGGTDNHMLVLDTVASAGIDGRLAEQRLDAVGITTNKQVIPDDPNPPLRPSGIRLGSPAATTRGMTAPEMRQLGEWIVAAPRARDDADTLLTLRRPSRNVPLLSVPNLAGTDTSAATVVPVLGELAVAFAAGAEGADSTQQSASRTQVPAPPAATAWHDDVQQECVASQTADRRAARAIVRRTAACIDPGRRTTVAPADARMEDQRRRGQEAAARLRCCAR